MPYRTCNFIKHDDVLCGSPAMRGREYCYFHYHQIHDASYGARARRRRYQVRFALPPLEDPWAIQDMLSQVAGALAADTIDPRRADAMISALRLASAELRRG